jgi:hypothetical protein
LLGGKILKKWKFCAFVCYVMFDLRGKILTFKI